ncbi:MAG: tRNA preQ1(34) S-adenosylmethionine ribosyltransferase-isomerase QueA [Bacteroidales bacterium]|jgi:S-adenosylmethionine:tRNA ribosyltransferase-isomerase|nr:tRNA preQ1(34) S-adenosylmethionine ribosyltransferase-isomerase QueA [Bacteroidales bacterium]MBQ6305656.1 tRNA preQ1(34) S-adenosylmethionine ribosyltransferase-isomerase QueA [Bacteroidales bacterium]MBR3426669.1 tRNA preQ1(34) S-adenosylmethionine ribosyltransferase-isomerase QueA [Bacteroidales bacterium]MBR6847902.1 tRNA preQ1(34) S-adenosylmethionine ribosyltransferase-isomerase QueA [Bacteroidales bacterium]
MKLSQFKFNLPSELIALHPMQNRDEARLMVVDRKTEKIEHCIFKDLINYVKDGDVFVINNTKVFPAKLYGEKEKTGAKIEVLLLRELDPESRLWDVLVDPARKIRIGNKLYFGEGDELVAEVIDNTTSRGRTLRFLYDGTYDEFKKTLSSLGHTPIPKELNRDETPEDAEDFQTIYAKVEGAVSAPTAGMHFSKILMKRLEIVGASFAELTLHPGMGNFRDIEVEDLTKHKPDSEEMYIDEECCTLVNEANQRHNNVFAVGTTSLKALETAMTISGKIKPFKGWTNKFIFPPYTFSVANCMITNFHLPKSPMMMEVAAFAGYDLLMKAYKEAIAEKYRFFTYGDAMLII